MNLCTVDYKKWGSLVQIHTTKSGAYLCGVVDESGAEVFVPAEEIVETHGPCIRLNRPRAQIDNAGWDVRPAALTR